MGDFPKIRSKRLIIRLLDPGEESLMPEFYRVNAEHLREFAPPRNPAQTLTEAYWKEEIPQRRRDFQNDLSVKLVMLRKDGARKIAGTINYSNIVRGAFQACHLGYSIGAEFERQGLMREALESANAHMFQERNFHRIMANYIPRNKRSEALLQRLGFENEGLAKNYLFINNTWEDHVLTSKCNPNWKPLT